MNFIDTPFYFLLHFPKFDRRYEKFNKKSTTIETIYFFLKVQPPVPSSKRLIAANFKVGHLSHCTFNTNTLFILFMNVETYFKKKAPSF